MKVTNTDHTAINDNHSKCRMNLIYYGVQLAVNLFIYVGKHLAVSLIMPTFVVCY